MPPVAYGMLALPSMWAFWSLESLRTATCAPTETRPAEPANASSRVFSVVSAWTRICPPADTCEPAPMDASACAFRFAIRIAAPIATTPPVAVPATPKKLRLSSACTCTSPEATTVPFRAATVPAGRVRLASVPVADGTEAAPVLIELLALLSALLMLEFCGSDAPPPVPLRMLLYPPPPPPDWASAEPEPLPPEVWFASCSSSQLPSCRVGSVLAAVMWLPFAG